MTVKTKITLFITGAGFIASLLFSVVVFFELIEQPFDLLDKVLNEEAIRTTRMVLNIRKSNTSRSSDTIDEATQAFWIEIYDPIDKRTLYRSALAASVALDPVKEGHSSIVRATVPAAEKGRGPEKGMKLAFRVRTFLIPLDGRSFVVQVARPAEKLEEEIRELAMGIVSGLVFSTLVLVVISRIVAGKILEPIGAMKDLARDISEKNLDQRIPAGEGRDEFSELAETINRMLDRLQYSFERQRDFLFDTSHELKTPLTTIRLAIEDLSAIDKKNVPFSGTETLSRLQSQVLRMERLVKDLLNLSALETLTSIDARPIELAGMLSALADDYQLLADARNIFIDIRVSERLEIHGDEEKIRRVFSNILDNAVKYNKEGGLIEIVGHSSDGGVTVTIGNAGAGLKKEEIPKVFNQFYRGEKSRSFQYGGSGLGLAIVKQIVELHRGRVVFESSRHKWTKVTVNLSNQT